MGKAKSSGIKKEMSIEQRKKIFRQNSIGEGIIIAIIVLFISAVLASYKHDYPLVDEIDKIVIGAFNELKGNFLYFLPPWDGGVFGLGGLFLFCVELLVVVRYYYGRNRLHGNINEQEGRTQWAEDKDIQDKYAEFDGDPKKRDFRNAYNNAICSQNTYISLNTRKHFHALNMLILGATGSGKSRYYLKPNILQMNSSFVITDPKGEILDSCGEMLRRNGYRVRVFDITTDGMKSGKTCHYNPLKYCYSEADIRKILDAFMKNVNPDAAKKSGGDPFWDEATRMFISACVGLLVQHPSNGDERPYGMIPEIMGGRRFLACFANLCELNRMAQNKWKEDGPIKLMDGVKIEPDKNAPQKASEVGAIFENLRAYEAKVQSEMKGEEISPDRIEKPYCLREWENFWGTPEKTATTINTTTATKLDAFNIKEVKNITSDDDINLDDFGKGRDALFLIIPPTDKTYNFLISFLYTQLFDILYNLGSQQMAGSKSLYLDNGEIVKFFSREEVAKGDDVIQEKIRKIKNARIKKVEGAVSKGYTKDKKGRRVAVTIDDGWYDILDEDDNLISRRQTKALADKYIQDLKSASLRNGKAPALPYHVRFLMDEFPNIGEVPEFQEKLATMRGYEISATVICQSITQLKGMYPDNFEVIDGNCPFVIFLGGDENSTNEYLEKKMGATTIIGADASGADDGKKITNMSYGVKKGALLRAEDFGRIDYSQEVVFIYGEMPIMDEKFDYPAHRNYKLTSDYAHDCGVNAVIFDRSVFADHSEVEIVLGSEAITSIPDIHSLSDMSELMDILGVTVPDGENKDELSEEEKEELDSAIVRYSFESQSTPEGF